MRESYNPQDHSELVTAPVAYIGQTTPLNLVDQMVTGATTDQLDEQTHILSQVAPQFAALLGERALSAVALRDIGRVRTENQDHCFAQVLAMPCDTGDVSIGMFVVADGMGGHHGGGLASRIALTTVVRELTDSVVMPMLGGERPPIQPAMNLALQAANAAVYETGQAEGSDMGTTCTAVLYVDDGLIVGHVGDSRALLIGSGARLLTVDHTAVGRLIAIGAITTDEAREHPLRNHLYRSIGQSPDVAVDVSTIALQGETHLVVCSDGMWGLVPEDEIVDIVRAAPTPLMAARQLIARANVLGGHDNISAVVVALPMRAPL